MHKSVCDSRQGPRPRDSVLITLGRERLNYPGGNGGLRRDR